MQLKSRGDLNIHKKEVHKSFKACYKFPQARCEYDSECNFLHIILKNTEQICFKCGEINQGKTEMINHIKEKHERTPFHKFQQSKCGFSSEDCLYSHINKNHGEQAIQVLPVQPTPDFHNIQQAPAPPEGPGRRVTREEILKRIMQMEENMRDLRKLMTSQ